jgi:hypothetical protein
MCCAGCKPGHVAEYFEQTGSVTPREPPHTALLLGARAAAVLATIFLKDSGPAAVPCVEPWTARSVLLPGKQLCHALGMKHQVTLRQQQKLSGCCITDSMGTLLLYCIAKALRTHLTPGKRSHAPRHRQYNYKCP